MSTGYHFDTQKNYIFTPVYIDVSSAGVDNLSADHFCRQKGIFP